MMTLTLAAHAHESGFSAAERACRSLVLDYAYYRDRYEAEAFADLFTDDAVLSVQGVDYVGRAAIKARILEARMLGDRARPVTHHHMSTIKILPADSETATGVSYVMVYSEPAGELPVATQGFLAAGEYHDRFRLTDAGWKIARREFRAVFTRPNP